MISINARLPYWETGYKNEKYLHRLSARIRGEEVVEYLGAKFNAGIREKEEKKRGKREISGDHGFSLNNNSNVLVVNFQQ